MLKEAMFELELMMDIDVCPLIGKGIRQTLRNIAKSYIKRTNRSKQFLWIGNDSISSKKWILVASTKRNLKM